MSNCLVVVDHLSLVDMSRFTRVISEDAHGFTAKLGSALVTCIDRTYLREKPLRSWCCGKLFNTVELACNLTVQELEYLLSRVSTAPLDTWCPSVLKEPFGVQLVKGHMFFYNGLGYYAGLYELPKDLTPEFIDDLGELAAGFEDEEFLDTLRRA